MKSEMYLIVIDFREGSMADADLRTMLVSTWVSVSMTGRSGEGP